MTLRHMKIFVAVFQHSNITRAAAELHLAQPSVSLAIKELEEYYGIQLFARIGRRISPTPCGREFYSYALHIVTLFEDMETKIKNWGAVGSIRIGTSITIGTHILPFLLNQYQLQYPSLKIQAVVGKSSDIEQKLLDNSLDIGLIETNPEHIDLCATPFMQDKMCAIVARDHPLASQKSVSLSQLVEYPFLVREKGSAGRDLLDACCSLQRLSLQILLESSSTQAIVKAVANGLGVAILPYLLVERDVLENVVEPLRLCQPLQRDLNIVYHKSKFLSPNLKTFIALCQRYGRDHEIALDLV